MKINPKRLLLGTANFKTKYGFKSFFISQKNSQDIINLAERRNPPAKIFEIEILENTKSKEGNNLTSTAIAKRYKTSI